MRSSKWPVFIRSLLAGFHRSLTAAAPSSGSTGHWPVPNGYQPLGTGKVPELFRTSVSSANILPVPSGQWPDGTGGSPLLPISISDFGFKPERCGRHFIAGRGKSQPQERGQPCPQVAFAWPGTRGLGGPRFSKIFAGRGKVGRQQGKGKPPLRSGSAVYRR